MSDKEITYRPQTTEPITPPDGLYPIVRIWSYASIDIERVVGKAGGHTVTRSVKRWNVTEASKARLHKAVGNLVNKGVLTIHLFSGEGGIGYEVEA